MDTNRKVESFDEIVFEDRNKEYGAYVLRKSYNKRVTSSLAVSLFFILLVVAYPVVASYLDKTTKNNILKHELTTVLDKYEKDIDIPPPPPADNRADVVQQVKYMIPTVVDSVTTDVQVLSIDELSASTGLNDNNQNVSIEVVPENIEVVDTKKVEVPFVVVEEMPEFPGGEQELLKFIASHVVYPNAAKEGDIKGKVFVRFVITSAGAVDQVQIARPIDPLLDAEAIRVVKLLPKWKPGKQQGNAVSVWYTVPINFQLNNQ